MQRPGSPDENSFFVHGGVKYAAIPSSALHTPGHIGSLRAVPKRLSTLTTVWPAGSPEAARVLAPRTDVVDEAQEADGSFSQAVGPFNSYRREVVVHDDASATETTRYRLSIPWFGWLFAGALRRSLRTRRPEGKGSPWWSPPDRLTERQARTLALLAAAGMSATFANTLFTQTSTFVADSFGVSERGLGHAGAIVRLGVIISLPFALLADRLGRRRIIVLLAWLTPLCCALGAAATNFPLLVASQTVGRPLGIALALLAAVAAAEEMPRNSRAYAVSVLAMAAGLGAAVAVAALRLTDLGPEAWRLVYLLSLVWLPVAFSLSRNLLETRRFETVHRIGVPLNRHRLALIATVALVANLFVAPASYFQNNYLDKVRGYSGGGIALFTLATGTPASLGLVVGGRIADLVGRRRLIAICSPISTVCIVAAFFASGPAMWAASLTGGFMAAMAYPAFAVYRAELFPTGNRGTANGLITATALLSGSAGILLVGYFRDQGYSYGSLMVVMALGQLAAAFVAYRWYPETAHLELEAMNPDDPVITER